MNIVASPAFIAALTELVWVQLRKSKADPFFFFFPLPPRVDGEAYAYIWITTENVAKDLECFSKFVFNPSLPLQITSLSSLHPKFSWAKKKKKKIGVLLRLSHAGRTTITTDDVLLLVRRNEELEVLIRDFIEKENASKARKRKR